MIRFLRPGFLTIVLAVNAFGQEPGAPVVDDETALYAFRSLEPQDVARVAELYRLTDLLGEALWPGFDTREIPIAINHDDREEMLFAHPSPPDEFHSAEALKLGDRPVLVRDGCTRYGPRGGGWAVDLGGEQTAYACTLQPRQATEEYLSLLIHECFHVYQRRFQSMPKGGLQEPPDDDAEYFARIGLESLVLQALLAAESDEEVHDLARQFVAVRRARHASLAEEQIRFEGINEYNEGTASYIQARLYRLLAERGGIEPQVLDAHYGGFENAARMYDDFVARITPPRDALIEFVHCQYLNGMGMCLALDRLRPDWKEEMAEPGRNQFELVERALAVPKKDEAELLALAEKRFEYAQLLGEQKALLEQRFATIRAFLEVPGRRYRIHHGEIRGRFKWKPEGPVFHVPGKLNPDAAQGPMTVWAGGLLRFEKGDLDFTGQPVPMIFRFDYFEWIDPDPAPDESDLHIEFQEQEEDVFTEVRIEADGGFVLTLPKARVVRTGEQVDIYPIVH